MDDFVASLPVELAIGVFSFLTPKQLATCSCVCKRWWALAQDDSLWRALFTSHKSLWLIHDVLHKSDDKQSSALKKHKREWRSEFATLATCNKRWRTATPKQTYFLAGHSGRVRGLMLDDEKIISGSDDSTIKVWQYRHPSVTTFASEEFPSIMRAPVYTLQGHTSSVNAIQFNKTLLVSGSRDKSVIIWNLHCLDDPKHYPLCRTLTGHAGSVWTLQLADTIIISGSSDTSIKIWDIEQGIATSTIFGHTHGVRAISLDSPRESRWLLASGSKDNQIMFWDVRLADENKVNTRSRAWVSTVNAHAGWVRGLQLRSSDSLLLSCATDGNVIVTDIRTFKPMHIINDAHQSWVWSVRSIDDIIVSCSWDTTIKVWQLSTLSTNKEPLAIYRHPCGVLNVQLSTTLLVSTHRFAVCVREFL